ncbi:TetR/AcrR family transcriptional regulator [Streptomyces sp. NBC_00377]|uniref:TetR/AcrR family transcriptional regulator n=1 Tax=unclassified Streptomyces TaxID=2593676 RepID=UPI002E2350B6|nr:MULTISPECIES: TetR/AcrR family transcriptional regulator [unclassified Streptomyces]
MPGLSSAPGGRREELLRQAETIILTEGFTAVTMDELAQRLGCSKATLYSLASTKEQLVLAVTRAFFREATAEIEPALSRPSPTPGSGSGSLSPGDEVWAPR